MTNGYRKADDDKTQRVVIVMPHSETAAIDDWGIPAGMPSRTSAVRFLIKKGLDTVKAQENRLSAG